MRGPDLLAWLAALPPAERDAALEEHLGIARPPAPVVPGEHLIGYHASGVAPIVRTLIEVPVVADDVVIDLGAGLGKVILLARLLTGAAARGIELQADLVRAGREAARRRGIDAQLVQGDAREADLDDGTVFFLYLPFTGPVLAKVVERLRAVASRRAIVVCALGVDVERDAPWLVRRSVDSFWLTIYDSRIPHVPPRPRPERSPMLGPAADTVAFEGPAATESTP
jgi:SAM-dependent methyltransferase